MTLPHATADFRTLTVACLDWLDDPCDCHPPMEESFEVHVAEPFPPIYLQVLAELRGVGVSE